MPITQLCSRTSVGGGLIGHVGLIELTVVSARPARGTQLMGVGKNSRYPPGMTW